MPVPSKKARARRAVPAKLDTSTAAPVPDLAAGASLAAGHVVQFYEADPFLVASAAGFVKHGLEAGDICLVVAATQHSKQIERSLQANGVELDAAVGEGTYLVVDAHEALRQILDEDGMPSDQGFDAVVGNRVAQLVAAGHRVRIFGEMVAILWDQENHAAALCLETLGNRLRASLPGVSICCAYPMSSVAGVENSAHFAQVCAQHRHVLPDESYADHLSTEERRRAITLLQQRARSLEVEVARREEVEVQLRASEQRYRLLFEAAQDGILLVDPITGTVSDANPAAAALLGLSHVRIVGRALWQIGVFPDRASAGAMLLELERRGTLRYDTLPLQRADGEARTVEILGTRFETPAGDLIQCTLRDVTVRRQMERRTEAALTALLSMAEALVSGSPPAVSDEVDLSRLAQGASPGVPPQPGVAATARRLAELTQSVLSCGKLSIASFEPETDRMHPLALVGFSTEEQRVWWAGWRPETTVASRLGADVAARLHAGEMVLLDVQAPPHRERLAPFHVQTLLLVPARIGDKLVGGLSLHYDDPARIETEHERVLAAAVAQLVGLVIERERLMREREEARASAIALSHANQRMSEFLSIASHELKTPVTVIKANLQLCSRRLRRAPVRQAGDQSGAGAAFGTLERAKELIERTEHGADRLSRLVDDLLDASRIQAGKLELRSEPVELLTVVREAVAEQRQANPQRAITFSAPPDEVTVVADRDRIGQVVTNYLTNAIKYSAEDRPVQVRAEFDQPSGVVRVSVRDEGPGLPPEEHAHIWELFHRAPQVKVQSGSGVGLGLGLHICKTIVEQHGGQVGLDSAIGRGSTFWFTLPLPSLSS
jgi:PAS domain S-box-containing protein